MTDGERAILDAIDGCDRVVAYCDEALDRSAAGRLRASSR
jgi:hypothetical protein